MPQENYKRLINAIRLIAADYSTQVQSLPYFVNVPDEVALIFDDAYLGFKGSEAEISIPHEARNRWGQSLGDIYEVARRVIYEVARRVKRTHSVAPSDGVLFGAVLLTINKPGLLF